MNIENNNGGLIRSFVEVFISAHYINRIGIIIGIIHYFLPS